MPGALAIVLVGYAQTLGGAKAAALQGGGDVDPNQELVAQGPANILSGLFGGFLAVGSLSKTSVAMAAGARSQLANLAAAALCFLTLLVLTPLFRGMPHPALAAIVIAAMLHLSKPDYLRHLIVLNRAEFAITALVFIGELTLGVLQGIAAGVAVALLMLIYRATHPRGAALGQLPGTEAYRDTERRPEAVTFPGLLIWRVGGTLFFASVGHFVEELTKSLDESRPPVKHILLDADAVTYIDSTACDELLRLIEELRGKGVTLSFARVSDRVRDFMRRAGVETAVGPANFYDRVTDGLHGWQTASGISSIEPARAAPAGAVTE